MRYRAVYHASPQSPPRREVVSTPAAAARPSTTVLGIYPSADVLPENLLKLYVHFSASMSRGEAHRRIRLLDESGQPVELAFLEIDQELWDRDLRRLTLLFDPGRVKRDLLPRGEVGSPLRAGVRYTLVIDRDWPDAHGTPLDREARKAFLAGPPDYDPPRTSAWRVLAPNAGTRDPLRVTFPEPLDHALLARVLEIADASGKLVPGAIAVEGSETGWRFVPNEPWRSGDYLLRAATILEDLAGNSLSRRFEVDVFLEVEDRVLRVNETLRFRIE